ncbi:hypothetical protein QNH39_10105 [Neobacillus novalis]|uniref:Uncharacterized protein n=1 Tax=Neobacillus novalis TaxID=220687 RepID=A0AA95SIR8_9BACI|nr:hypothetical protein [Neobacillus novalis]WHY88166.1 hypothetical protein QNH39_10105 [Neobacillus novalis]
MEQDSSEKNARITAFAEQFIQLRNRGTALSAKDKNSLAKVAGLDVPLEKLLKWMKEIHLDYSGHSPLGTINSMAYYEAAILTRMSKGNAKNKKGTESLKERMARLEKQGKLT